MMLVLTMMVQFLSFFSTLLGSANLSTLIPTSVRRGV